MNSEKEGNFLIKVIKKNLMKLTKHIYVINIIKSLFLFSIILIISCNKDRTIGPHKCYLHLSHTRTNSNLFFK